MDEIIAKHQHNKEFLYMLLSRLKGDCEYYLGFGNRRNSCLWSLSPESHIENMRKLHDCLDEKPEWLTLEEINNYEVKFKDTSCENAKI